jgi:hypothetical protein
MDDRAIARRFGAASLLLVGVATTVGTLIEPSGGNDKTAVMLAKVAAHQGAQRVLIVLDLLGVFALPAVLALWRLARPRAWRLALAGGTLAFAGWLAALLLFCGLDLVDYHAARLPDRAAGIALAHAVENDPAAGVLLAVFLLGTAAGMLILGIALWRSRAVPRWAAALVSLGPIVSIPLHEVDGALTALAQGGLAVGLAGCAVAVLRTSDDLWNLPADSSRSAQQGNRAGRARQATSAAG